MFTKSWIMDTSPLHRTQLSILHSLRYANAERFSELMRPTKHTSDTFKFHIQKLIRLGYVFKLDNGQYALTSVGKEFAITIDELNRTVQKQPKISVMVVASRINHAGVTEYLMQERTRNPHFGFINEIHGRAEWGQTFKAIAAKQLKRQTGLEAEFTVHSFRRMRDFDQATGDLFEDKLFVVMKANNLTGELSNDYKGGENFWISLEAIRAYDKHFTSTIAIIESLQTSDLYHADDSEYAKEDY